MQTSYVAYAVRGHRVKEDLLLYRLLALIFTAIISAHGIHVHLQHRTNVIRMDSVEERQLPSLFVGKCVLVIRIAIRGIILSMGLGSWHIHSRCFMVGTGERSMRWHADLTRRCSVLLLPPFDQVIDHHHRRELGELEILEFVAMLLLHLHPSLPRLRHRASDVGIALGCHCARHAAIQQLYKHS